MGDGRGCFGVSVACGSVFRSKSERVGALAICFLSSLTELLKHRPRSGTGRHSRNGVSVACGSVFRLKSERVGALALLFLFALCSALFALTELLKHRPRSGTGRHSRNGVSVACGSVFRCFGVSVFRCFGVSVFRLKSERVGALALVFLSSLTELLKHRPRSGLEHRPRSGTGRRSRNRPRSGAETAIRRLSPVSLT